MLYLAGPRKNEGQRCQDSHNEYHASHILNRKYYPAILYWQRKEEQVVFMGKTSTGKNSWCTRRAHRGRFGEWFKQLFADQITRSTSNTPWRPAASWPAPLARTSLCGHYCSNAPAGRHARLTRARLLLCPSAARYPFSRHIASSRQQGPPPVWRVDTCLHPLRMHAAAPPRPAASRLH